MRLFLAIDPPIKAKEEIFNQIQEIYQSYQVFNWIPQKDYHITVHFFGETDSLEDIKRKTEELLFDQEPFYLYANLLDVFINKKITLYLSFHNERRLRLLVNKCRQAFPNQLSNPKEFIPHMSLARYKVPSKQQYLHLKKKLLCKNMETAFLVKKIVLFESVLGKNPIYSKIKNFYFPAQIK